MASEFSNNPYAPTSSVSVANTLQDQDRSSAILSRVFTYQNGFMAKLTCILLGGCIFADVVNIVSSAMQLNLLQGSAFTDEQASANDIREQVAGALYLVIFLLTAIIFSTWINRAHHNVRGFGAESMTITPGWAVGYFFIPIFNLYRPYTAMCELWRASQSPGNWTSNSSGLVPLWWTLWIVSLILGRISAQLSRGADNIEGLIMVTWMNIAVAALAIPLALVAMRMLMTIQKMQDDWSKGPVETAS